MLLHHHPFLEITMALTINAKTYTADGFSTDSVHFQGPAQTTTVEDGLIQKKYRPKATATSSGKSQFLVKFNRSHTLTGAKEAVGSGSMQILFIHPVGISDADRDAYCSDAGAYIASAGFKAALKAGQPNG
jgi:hypothetical protein